MRTIAAIGIVVVLCAAVYGQDSPAPQITAAKAVNSADSASRLAVAYSGLDQFVAQEKANRPDKVGLSHLDRLNIPFLWKDSVALSVWHLTYEDVRLNLTHYDDSLESARSKDVEVWIDSLTGKLIALSMSDPGVDTASLPLCDLTEAENQLLNHVERYYGLPDAIPSKSLIQTLNDQVTASPVQARFVLARYLSHSCQKKEPVDSWVVHFYGVPPGPAGNTDVRFVFDANTGAKRVVVTLPFCPR